MHDADPSDYLHLKKSVQLATMADSSGIWHNEFMDICLADKVVMDTTMTLSNRKVRINDMAASYFSIKLGMSENQVASVVNSFLNDKEAGFQQTTDSIRGRIYGKILETYSDAETAQQILFVVDSLKQSDNLFIHENHDVRAVLEVVEKSVTYWSESLKFNALSKTDPLTPRQRQILNADADGAITGAAGGLITGGPWGAVACCIIGAGIGSIYEAVVY